MGSSLSLPWSDEEILIVIRTVIILELMSDWPVRIPVTTSGDPKRLARLTHELFPDVEFIRWEASEGAPQSG